ncbi:MAG TPA: CGNR zinc finger domain-containing protein [Candidatus Limnocylindrales bacterium]|nr:CGNR zinc finger domain-containing protein [Candidatus Limnocylindrales bacterium]
MSAKTPKVGGHRPTYDHHHQMSLEDTSDFMNTIELESGSLVDHLASFDDAAHWLTDRGMCHEDLAPSALAVYGVTPEQALEKVRSVRAALREVADAVAHDRAPSDEALAEVNRAIRSRERVELVKEHDGVSVGHSHVGDPLDDALARLADPLVHEIQNGRADRVRICANDTCRWLFFDESRAGRRIWCDMATCGNKAKAARHRARAKAKGGAASVASIPLI